MTGGNALATVTMAMAMTVPVESKRCTTEAAIRCAAISWDPAVWTALLGAFGAAVASWHKTHRNGADGGRTHHGQNDAA
jgi:hypothetical protein